MNESSWLEIDLSCLETNLGWWRCVLGGGGLGARGAAVCVVVKSNAYGLGAAAVSHCLERAGVDMLAVYSEAQAVELLEAGIRAKVLVLMPTREWEASEAVCGAMREGRLHFSVNDPGRLEMIGGMGRRLGCRLPVHLHLDTGMSRAGLSSSEFAGVLAGLGGCPFARLAGIYSHLVYSRCGRAEELFDREQVERLDRALEASRGKVPAGVMVHLANTAGAIRDSGLHRDMARIGLGMYGYLPAGVEQGGAGDCLQASRLRTVDKNGLRPVMRWLGGIIHVQRYPAGATVGYEGACVLKRESVLGVVPVGYADGYPLALSNRGTVGLLDAGRDVVADAPVLGRVSMDQIVIDLTEVRVGEEALGSVVELISNDPSSPRALNRVAEAAGSSPYELLCRLSPRLPRRYVQAERGGLLRPVVAVDSKDLPAEPATASLPGRASVLS